MEITEIYTNSLERKAKIAFQESQKFRLVSDTFDSNWKQGEEPHGSLIFTDVNISTPPAPIPTDWKALWLAADTPAKKLAVLAKRLGLE